MSELRWTLLILGVVFITALSWWERRRPRQAFAPRLREGREPRVDRLERSATVSTAALEEEPGRMRVAGEPWIGETALSDTVLPDVALGDPDSVYERTGGSSVSARLTPAAPGPLEELPTLVIPDADERLALRAAWDAAPPEPVLIDPDAQTPVERGTPVWQSESPRAPETSDAVSETASPAQQASAPIAAEPVPPAAVSEPPEEIPGAEGVGHARVVEPAVFGGAAPVEPLVDWPPEESRTIMALRLVAPHAERFGGRALRLALAAEGFLLGKYSIFHRPDEANRAILSAASLTRPGAFDLATMDTQRYAGISLFTVLPGPKAPPQAFEELLAAARNLNERLQGALQDEQGGPLTALRVASLRESVRAEAAPITAAAANET